MHSDQQIIWLENIRKDDVAVAGGKGASLGEMINAGINVPPGFVIASFVFDEFIKEANLKDSISAMLSKVNPNDLKQVEAASKEIMNAVTDAKMPDGITKEILVNFEKLGSRFVAVRSSATAEDSSAASWAGQLESYLNTDSQTLLQNIKRCWASLYTPRAITYRFEQGLNMADVSVSVIVQKMVQSDISGIAFSVNPVSQDPNELIIEAGYGLGEAIVSGQITPDSYSVDKSNLSITKRKLGGQRRALYKGKNKGVEWKELPQSLVGVQILKNMAIEKLAKLVTLVEKHYGFPCDIEWAIEDEQIYIVQSRPITTLVETPSEQVLREVGSIRNWVIMNSSVLPYIVGFGVRQWTQRAFERYSNNKVITLCGIRYTKNGDEIQYVASEDEYRDSATHLLSNLGIIQKIYDDFVKDESDFRAFVSGIKKNGDDYLYDNFDDFIRCYDAVYSSGIMIDGVLIYGSEFVDQMKKRYPEFGEEILELTRPHGEIFLERYRRKLISRSITDINETADLRDEFHWMHNNYKDVEGLPEEYFQKELRREREKDINELKNELEHIESNVKKHAETIEKIRKRCVFDKADFDKLYWIGMVGWWVDRRKEYNLIANHYLDKYLKHVCKKYNFDYDAVSFLLPWELDSVINGEKGFGDYDIDQRKKNSFHFYDVYGNEAFLLGKDADSMWLTIQATIRKSGLERISGQTAWRGRIAGKARIVKNPKDAADFKEGDILVTGMTRPDFLPLMQKAVAFVTDEGGITCHAAIMAREMRKPCVTGTKIATKIIKDGDLIEVDANANYGAVRIMREPNA